MVDNSKTFNVRLSRIWEPPNFFSLVAAIKRPPASIKKGRILFSDGDILERLHYIQEGFIATDVTTRIAYFLLDFITRFCKVGKSQTIT
ncbi:MAG: hypothetical protein M1365_08715, partial [Actinobacteria bacterium]|nr:hypothetical protein [Actinomycetota bacterium]